MSNFELAKFHIFFLIILANDKNWSYFSEKSVFSTKKVTMNKKSFYLYPSIEKCFLIQILSKIKSIID